MCVRTQAIILLNNDGPFLRWMYVSLNLNGLLTSKHSEKYTGNAYRKHMPCPTYLFILVYLLLSVLIPIRSCIDLRVGNDFFPIICIIKILRLIVNGFI